MGDEKVDLKKLTYCRFCGGWAGPGEYVQHRGRCKRAFVAEIDHIPVERWWCPRCETLCPGERRDPECPGCEHQKLVRRFV